MFGHLRVRSCGLEVNDRALYRSHFCGVCHSLHAFAGWDASLLTNYDVTLWSLVASAVSTKDYQLPIEMRSCTALPFHRVEVQPLSPDLAASLASLTVLLAWAKVEDQRQDGKAVLGWAGRVWLGRKEARARDWLSGKGYPLDSLLQLPARQAEAESRPSPRLADLARPTCQALGEAFVWIAALAERPDLSEPLRSLGESIASFVYLWDALEDLEKDHRRGDFNAVRAVWGGPVEQTRGELLAYLLGMEQALEELPLGNRRRLCAELTASLRARVLAHPALKALRSQPRSPRRLLNKAGFVRPSCDCDCDVGNCCCEANCCDTGSDCNCCELSLCDCHKGDACCELSCCDCCGDGGDTVLCCCIDRHHHRGCCCDACGDCCDAKRKGKGSITPALEPSISQSETLLCPGCRHDLFETSLAGAAVLRCRKCEGVWIDGGQSDAVEADIRGLRAGRSGSTSGVARGHRTCPRCRCLLRSPFDSDAAETCDSCGGRFLQG